MKPNPMSEFDWVFAFTGKRFNFGNESSNSKNILGYYYHKPPDLIGLPARFSNHLGAIFLGLWQRIE